MTLKHSYDAQTQDRFFRRYGCACGIVSGIGLLVGLWGARNIMQALAVLFLPMVFGWAVLAAYAIIRGRLRRSAAWSLLGLGVVAHAAASLLVHYGLRAQPTSILLTLAQISAAVGVVLFFLSLSRRD